VFFFTFFPSPPCPPLSAGCTVSLQAPSLFASTGTDSLSFEAFAHFLFCWERLTVSKERIADRHRGQISAVGSFLCHVAFANDCGVSRGLPYIALALFAFLVRNPIELHTVFLPRRRLWVGAFDHSVFYCPSPLRSPSLRIVTFCGFSLEGDSRTGLVLAAGHSPPLDRC